MKVGLPKPVVVSHHMMFGLKEGQAKMSKSDPDSAIFMEDTEKEVVRKIKGAYCPNGVITENPILDYIKHIIFGFHTEFLVKRKEQYGGDRLYTSYEELEKEFADNLMDAGDIKTSLAREINKLLQPVRDHFANNEEAKALLQKVREINEEERLRKENLKTEP